MKRQVNSDKVIKKYNDELFYFKDEDNNLCLLKKINNDKVKNLFGDGIVKSAYQEFNYYYSPDRISLNGTFDRTKKLDYENCKIDNKDNNIETIFNYANKIEDSDKKNIESNFDMIDGDIYIEFINNKIIHIYTSEWGDIESFNDKKEDEIF